MFHFFPDFGEVEKYPHFPEWSSHFWKKKISGQVILWKFQLKKFFTSQKKLGKKTIMIHIKVKEKKL